MVRAYRVRYQTVSPGNEGECVLFQLPIRIGRSALNNCPIAHPYISDFHAVVELVEGRLCVRDLNSKNGIYTPNGERLAKNASVPLASPGAAFVLAGAIRVQIDELDQSQAPAPQRHGGANTMMLNRHMLEAGLRASEPPGAPNASGAAAHGVRLNSHASLPSHGSQPPVPQPTPGALPTGPFGQPAPSAAALNERASRSHPDARRSSAPSALDTGYLSMSVETLALQGLRELAGSLVPGAPFETTGDIARLLRKVHDTVEVFCRCFVPLREGYAQFVSSMDLQRAATQRTLNRSASALRLEGARDPAAVAAALLDWRNADFDPPEAVASIFADLMTHQIALVEGVMRGVQALLEELSPENLERLQRDEGQGLGAVLGRHRALWKTFERRYAELTSEKQTFERVFGPEFAASYREYSARQPKVP